jgi:outer membrane protein OmpA-like peptidoglycan-associated protein
LAAAEEARRLAAAEEARRRAATEEARQSSEIETRRALADAAAVKSVRIQFSPDRTELTEAEKAKIREIVPLLLRYPGRRILVEGYTALAGNEAGRLRISTERAQAVADFLVSLNVRRAGEISVRGYGAQRPVGNNATAAGRTMNRRVEITLLDE